VLFARSGLRRRPVWCAALRSEQSDDRGCLRHLHVHSEYSLLDGRVQESIGSWSARRRLASPPLGLTDHGVMNGAVELYKAAKKAGIKPIVGCEVYFVDDHAAVAARASGSSATHLTLLAASDVGYRNLVKLSSAGFLEDCSAAARPSTWLRSSFTARA